MRRSGTLLAAGAMLAMLLVVGAQAQQAQRQFENQSAQRGFEAASDLIGARIENPQGDNLGSVSDLVVDPQSGQVAYVILSRGGVLGIGAKLYPIPWQAARYNRQNERLVVDLSESQLDSAPNFSGDNWPDLASPTWRQRVHSFYQTRGMGGSQGLAPGQQLFDASSVQTLSGRITDVSTSTTRAGNQQITVQADDGRSVLVDLAPASYLRDKDINFDVGDKVSVRGSRIEHGGKDMLIATQVRTDAGQVQLRSSQGQPLWQGRGMGGSQEQFHRQQDNMNGSGAPRQMDNDNGFNRRIVYRQEGAAVMAGGNDFAEGSNIRAQMIGDDADMVTSSRLIRASKLMDKSLRFTQDQRIGSIEDLAIDLSTGKVEYAVVGAGGGFLGIDQDLHAIPWDAVRYDSGRETIMLDASKQKIENAPSFKRDEWSNLSDPAWQSRIDRYYSTQGSQDQFRGEHMNQGRFQDGGQMQPQD